MLHFPSSTERQRLIRPCIADLELLAKVEVVYVTLPGWKQSIASARTFAELPDNCKKYIGFIENTLDVPIEWIGVGPGRESMVAKKGKLEA